MHIDKYKTGEIDKLKNELYETYTGIRHKPLKIFAEGAPINPKGFLNNIINRFIKRFIF